MEIPQTTLPASCRICMQVKKRQLEQDMEQQTGSKLGKEYIKGVYCHPAYLTYLQSTSCKMLGWMNHKLESRLAGKIPTTSDMHMTSPLWQKAAAKSHQLYPTLCDPHRQQPTRFLCPWDSPGKNTGVSCYFLLHGRRLRGTKELLDEDKRGE